MRNFCFWMPLMDFNFFVLTRYLEKVFSPFVRKFLKKLIEFKKALKADPNFKIVKSTIKICLIIDTYWIRSFLFNQTKQTKSITSAYPRWCSTYYIVYNTPHCKNHPTNIFNWNYYVISSIHKFPFITLIPQSLYIFFCGCR